MNGDILFEFIDTLGIVKLIVLFEIFWLCLKLIFKLLMKEFANDLEILMLDDIVFFK